jgi:putative Ca2+/H+ antiporter (TMEM165/GDT1 family)
MLRLFISTFALIFIAELGDKTQLATLAIASDARTHAAPWVVFAGSALALIATSALAVIAGSFLERTVHPGVVKWISAALFVAAAIWTVLKR